MMLSNKFKKSIAMATAASMTFGMLAVVPVKAKAADVPPESPKRNVIYYGDWSVWGGQGNFYIADVAADQYTHLNYAFLDFDSEGNLVYTDKDAATGVPMGQEGVGWGRPNAGVLPALINMRAKYPNCKIGVSVGGWSKSADFTYVARDATIRKKFVDNLMKFVKYNEMDFLDIDWEYPGAVRQPDKLDNQNDEGTPGSIPQDKENYVKLLRELKDGLNALGEETGKEYELSIALCASNSVNEVGLDVQKIFEIIDFGNIMTYDMTGAWSDISGHQAGLFPNPHHPNKAGEVTASGAVDYLVANGAPKDKLVVGSAMYSRGWDKVSIGPIPELPGLFGEAAVSSRNADLSPSRGALNEAPLKAGDGGYCGGIWGFRNFDKLKTVYPGLKEYWDDYAKAPYLYATNGGFFTYDNERSITEKTKYILDEGLGGIIHWMTSNDKPTTTTKRDALAKAAKTGLYGSEDIPANELIFAPKNFEVSFNEKPSSSGSGVEYEITFKNNETADESGEVLTSTEAIYETAFLPRFYIKTDKPLVGGSYPSGHVTNKNGYTVVDFDGMWGLDFILQGESIKFHVKTADASPCSISSIEMTQRTLPSGEEIRRQMLYTDGANKAPTLLGVSDKTIEVGQEFDAMERVTAKDLEDGDLTANIQVTGTVNTSQVGTYTLTYTVSDSKGLEAVATRTIKVDPVNTPPVFHGIEDKIIKIGEPFDKKAGVTAIDAEDGDITSKMEVVGTVNRYLAGVYPIYYSVVDSKGDKVLGTRIIKVVEPVNTAPIISGADDKTINFGESFDAKAGVTATDDEDGDITKNISVRGAVDVMKAGQYTLTYTVNDSEGLSASVDRVITVLKAGNTPPVLSGLFDKTIVMNDEFDPMAGVIAIDNEDGNITESIQIEGTVDTSKSGTYPLTYTVVDSEGLEARGVRVITVGEPQQVNTAPKLIGVSDRTIKVGEYLDKTEGITADDAEDGDITAKINVLGVVDIMTSGTYTLRYSVADSKGLKDTASCTITVEEEANTAPVLSGITSTKTINVGEIFDPMAGVTAIDAEDGDITESITIKGNVDTSRMGIYTLNYIVVDSKGEYATAKCVVTVRKERNKKPTLRL